jgi:hypothetical protein
MDVRAMTSTDRTTSLRMSLFGMTFSFASRLKPLRLRGTADTGTIRAAVVGVND